jgi:CRP/FNR family cyclic AMP-dependent transcriptional regulator
VREHERCIGLIVVLHGAVKIFKFDSRGREFTLGLDQPGSCVGELPLFDGGNYPASAEAMEPDTTVFIVPRDRFLALMATYPQIAEQAVRALAVRMRKLVEQVEAQSLHTVRTRLAAYLLGVSEGRGSVVLVDTNEEIGSRIGTVREVVSRTLRSLKEAGVIAISGRRIDIRDAASLSRIAESGE